MTVLCQCWLMMFVTFVSQKRYLRSFQTSAMQKNLIPFGGELPSGLSNRDDTSAGTSCGWQFNPARFIPPQDCLQCRPGPGVFSLPDFSLSEMDGALSCTTTSMDSMNGNFPSFGFCHLSASNS